MSNKFSTIGEEIVCTESTIKMTSEKMKGKLSKAYEIAREDVQKKKWYNYFSVGFSIAGTLLIALLTTSFKTFDWVDGNILTRIAWGLLGASLLYSIVAVCFKAKNNSENEHKERDKAVNSIIDEIKKGE